MPPLVVFDARDAHAAQARGWNRYASCLLGALLQAGAADYELLPLSATGRGPEFVFEQLRLPLALRRRRAALVHAPNCFLPLVRPCPGVVTVHDLAFEAWPSDFAPRTRIKYRTLARLAARSAERVICPSISTRDDLCARWGVAPERTRVIPEAPALPIGTLRSPVEGPYVLGVGDLRQKKDFASLVRAYVTLRSHDGIPHKLVLAGLDSGEGPRLRALAGDAPVELTGYVDDQHLDALIRGAQVLVHPSLYEGFGLVLLEAMARGTPVIAARATSLPEVAGDAAEYFEPGDPDSLAESLRTVLRDPAVAVELALRGSARAAEFSWERAARATAEVYRELL
jgi:glycosyltransferase involved in cell wall biosynthesis